MLVTIKEACKLADISRTNFYKNYIYTGKVSVVRDGLNRPKIDTSEILRVFGKLHDEQSEQVQNTLDYTDKRTISTQIAILEIEKNNLSIQLTETKTMLSKQDQEFREREQQYQEREAWQRGQIEKLTDTIKLLEAPKGQNVAKRGWWQFWK